MPRQVFTITDAAFFTRESYAIHAHGIAEMIGYACSVKPYRGGYLLVTVDDDGVADGYIGFY